MRPRASRRRFGVLALAALADTAWAQSEAPLPPRILEVAPGSAPGEAVLARLPEEREEALEEIVVIGEDDGWRLPDLGATWRMEHETPTKSRLAVRFLPLYDPELADRLPDIFLVNRQQERIGYLELFRIRFGAEPQRTVVPTVTEPDP